MLFRSLTEGEWDVYLGLSSIYESLAKNPAYSVRFANKHVWDANLGLNKIGTITVKASGENGENEFVQITNR